MRCLLPLLLGMLVGACSAKEKPAAAHPSDPSPVTVEVTRECELTLHAETDVSVEGRKVLANATEAWRNISQGRIRIGVEYDVDFDSVANLKEHQAADHSFVFGVTSDSDIVEELDAKIATPTSRPMAVTVSTESGAKHVWLILDRIPRAQALDVVTHELGHVCGLPDLPSIGSIMSGASLRNAQPLDAFTSEDVALCRAYKYCK